MATDTFVLFVNDLYFRRYSIRICEMWYLRFGNMTFRRDKITKGVIKSRRLMEAKGGWWRLIEDWYRLMKDWWRSKEVDFNWTSLVNWSDKFLAAQSSSKNSNLNCEETQKLKLWSSLKTQILMKLKKWWNPKNSNRDKNKKKLKLWWNSKNSNCHKIQKLKFWWNSKT